MHRQPGLSVRVKLTLSYAGFLMVAGALLLAAVWWFLLRYVPERALIIPGSTDNSTHGVFPVRSNLLRVFAPRAFAVLTFLLVFGLVIRLSGRQDEFRELADAIDGMLARLDADVAAQRRFAANASHELRTPLATSKALLDVARSDPNRDTGELIERLRAVNTRALHLTEELLLLSRAEQRTFTREPVDLSLMAEEATETLLPLAEKHGVTIETDADITPTTGSEALLLQLTMNLVHNAIVHNRTEHGAVWVTTGVRPKTVVLTVENTGEKITPEVAATLTEPFQRGTERVRTDHAGVGLGLAIAKTITHAHDGTLTLTPRPAGGLRVTVELPAAAQR